MTLSACEPGGHISTKPTTPSPSCAPCTARLNYGHPVITDAARSLQMHMLWHANGPTETTGAQRKPAVHALATAASQSVSDEHRVVQ